MDDEDIDKLKKLKALSSAQIYYPDEDVSYQGQMITEIVVSLIEKYNQKAC